MAEGSIRFPLRRWADLPSPITTPRGTTYFCPDAAFGASLVMSDGDKWRIFARGLQVQRKPVPSNGVVTFTHVPAFGTLPALFVTLTDGTGGGKLSYSVTAESMTECTVTVQRGRTLPAPLTLLSQLLGFDPFSGGTIGSVTAHLLAFPVG